MTAMPATQTMTAEEFLALPEDPFGQRSILVEGELVLNQPTWPHQRAAGELFFALTTWSRAAAGRGEAILPIDVQLDERNVYAPDILWYRDGRAPTRDARAPYPMPALAIEVRSPSTWRHDIGAKKSGYEREGLPELWLVDTAADEVLVFRRSSPDSPRFDVSEQFGRADPLTSPLLPDFALPLQQLFGD
jgi:Uma2 family endonuclease